MKLRFYWLIMAGIIMVGCKKNNPADDTIPPLVIPGADDPIQNIYLDITHDTTLTNINAGTDYRLANSIRILNGATLTIEKGVTIEVVQDAAIEIRENSALRVNGTKTDSVVFTAQYTGVTKPKGFWKGLYYYQVTNSNNRLSHCTIEYAGGEVVDVSKKAAINLYGSTIELDTCNIQKNKVYGLYVDETSSLAGIHGCNFTKNDAEPVLLWHTNCDVLTGDNYFSFNLPNSVTVKSITAVNSSRPLNLKKLPVPYAFNGFCRFAEPVTLNPGVRIQMQQAGTLYFDNTISGNAKLTAVGTFSDSIRITGAIADSGFWYGIGFYKGGECHLEYCRLSDAGTEDVYGTTPPGIICFSADNTSPPGIVNIVHSTIAMCTYFGIVIKDPEFSYNADIETSNSFVNVNGTHVVYF